MNFVVFHISKISYVHYSPVPNCRGGGGVQNSIFRQISNPLHFNMTPFCVYFIFISSVPCEKLKRNIGQILYGGIIRLPDLVLRSVKNGPCLYRTLYLRTLISVLFSRPDGSFSFDLCP